MSDCIRCLREAVFCAEHANERAVALRVVVEDLKARLREVRRLGPVFVGDFDERELFRSATDLRVKKWRKP